MSLEQRHLEFLTDVLGTQHVRHSGRNLCEHLFGTYTLLEEWGAPEEARLAGLFHSIYGTNAFKHRSLDITSEGDRDLVRVMIGAYAEWLVYVFCSTDRPGAFLVACGYQQPSLRDRITDQWIDVTHQDLRNLLEIEAANLLEQGAREKTLWRMAACPVISESARRALRKRLGEKVSA